MLVSTIDRAIDGDVPIDIVCGVGISENLGEDTVPGAVGGVAVVSFPHCLPGAEVLTWEVAPGDTCPISIHDAFDDPAIVLKRACSLTCIGGQERLDALPLFVGEDVMSLVCSHSSSVSVQNS